MRQAGKRLQYLVRPMDDYVGTKFWRTTHSGNSSHFAGKGHMMSQVPSSAEPERPRVLLVEDDSAVRRSIQLILHARGYDVRAFSSGALALADPSALDAACLVTDYRMAGMSGLELLRGLRAVGWQRPAILITGDRSDHIEDMADGLFDEILEKPLLDRRLCAWVDRATGRA